ncbi:hypothetical protein U0C82_06035 [Fulvimarina sp. 2208YS6-2-32]|uniref:Uncharacterized protein n=1 Tax=Fulvimarina uroteuthidis TaxID=3098149 RepID=A0ABU5I169_9HYPH|nr:hypothetical protein [Fulvimarina sp. 2208YS6-2-32]MDY8108708.1 hypothetical protein [Fulvimarina sp. 2208YS6-2-32]
MILADAEDIELDVVGNLDHLEKIGHAIGRRGQFARRLIREDDRQAVDAGLLCGSLRVLSIDLEASDLTAGPKSTSRRLDERRPARLEDPAKGPVPGRPLSFGEAIRPDSLPPSWRVDRGRLPPPFQVNAPSLRPAY